MVLVILALISLGGGFLGGYLAEHLDGAPPQGGVRVLDQQSSGASKGRLGEIEGESRNPLGLDLDLRVSASVAIDQVLDAHFSLRCVTREDKVRAFICWWQAKQVFIIASLVEGLPSWK